MGLLYFYQYWLQFLFGYCQLSNRHGQLPACYLSMFSVCVASIFQWWLLRLNYLKGSALGDGMVCISRKICSTSATSVSRILPSGASIFKPLQFVTVWFPSASNLFFNTRQYTCGFGLSVKAATTSTIATYHFSCTSSHAVQTFYLRKVLVRFYLSF